MKKALKSIVGKGLQDDQGATVILIALLMVVFLGVTALAVDGSHLIVVRNELQNAADAGALAGARVLYNSNGTQIQGALADATALDAARENKALAETGGAIAVDVHPETDVQRGHWSFATHTFTPNNSETLVDLWDVSTEELDANTDFINAVRVVARRQDTRAASFFARIFGYQNFALSAEAVGYIGFAGTLTPHDVDQPIAICKESILINDEYSCNIGRMINSGQNVASSETGGWTSFSQGDDACTGGTNSQEVRSLVCGGGNPGEIILGGPIATNGGEIQVAFNTLISCWETNSSGKTQPWELTLPVIECPGNNVTTCQKVVGAVTLNIVWITEAGEDPQYNNAPTQMGAWSNGDSDGQARWNSFVSSFHLQNVDGSPAPYEKKSIYFLPSCEPHELTGKTGGENFGVLAKIPVLVK